MQNSPQLWGRIILSLFGGVITFFGLFFLLLMTTRRDSETPLVEANPFAWVLFWPDLIWNRMLSDQQAETASLATSILTFSILIYITWQLMGRLRR
jgi:hypothetical protein